MERVYIVGAGAIGTYLAVTLAPHAEVRVVVRDRERAARLARSGLGLTGVVEASLTLPVLSMDGLDEVPEGALVVLTMKTTGLAAALEALAPRLPASCPLVLAQNGLGVIEAARPLAPAAPLVRAACWMGVVNAGLGQARVAGVHSLVIGPSAEPGAVRLEALARAAQIPTALLASAAELEWKKALWNLAVNPLCALLDQPNGVILDEPPLRRVAERLLDEATRVAAACGVSLGAEDRERVFSSLGVTRANINATLQDLRAGREPETAFLSGAVVRLGLEHGVDTPLFDMLTNLSEYLEKSAIRKA